MLSFLAGFPFAADLADSEWFGDGDFQSAFCDIQRPLHNWEPPGNKETEQSPCS